MLNVIGMVRNALTMRQQWIQKLFDPRRDIDVECGHPQEILAVEYVRLFQRGDIAYRVVSLFPDESWATSPFVYEVEDEQETEFEKAWQALEQERKIFAVLQRADVVSGIGRFGIVLLGFDDGLPLDQAVEDSAGVTRKLLFLRPLDESCVTIKMFESDITNPRYGQPTSYSIQFQDSAYSAGTLSSTNVHWSRVIHIADNRHNSEIFGAPRMEKVYNRLLDLRKIAGGSGEMFWKGGFPGLSLEAVPTTDGSPVELDKEATQEQMDAYMNGLQRYIATVGMQVRSLGVQVADPRPHMEIQIQLIAIALGVPWRLLMGSEVGQLASSQDSISWNRRIKRRREMYLDPYVIRELIDRLIAKGCLPVPKAETYLIDWEDLNSPSDDERATVAQKATAAMAQYVQSGTEMLVPPFHFFTLVMGMKDEEANAIIEAAAEDMADSDGEMDDQRTVEEGRAVEMLPPPASRGLV